MIPLQKNSLRENILWILTLVGLSTWLIVEGLNLFTLISFLPVFLLFNTLLISSACGILILYKRNSNLFQLQFPRLNTKEIILLGGIVIIVSLQLITAIFSAPNEGDSMAYHLTRVMHWIQNQSLEPFTIFSWRENSYPPFAEYNILLLQILTNSDRLANMVQWFSVIGTLLTTSLIARHLGASRFGQILSCFLLVTIPMGIIQGTTTQNDYVAAFWITASIYFLLQLCHTQSFLYAFGCGITIGLAFLTKGTSYLLLAPFLLFTLILLTKSNPQRALIQGLLITLITVSINLPHTLRLQSIGKSPIAVSNGLRNETIGIKPLFLNILRNTSMHLTTPSKEINTSIFNAINNTAIFLNMDSNDPRYTFPEKSFTIQRIAFDEHNATNPLHLLLIFIITIFIFCFHKRHPPETIFYLRNICLAIFLFNLILKWQPFHARFHLPFFIAFMPLCALWLSRYPKIALSICLILLAYAFPFIVSSYQRPLVGKENIFNTPREQQYFMKLPEIGKHYLAASKIINTHNCKAIGLYGHEAVIEYSLWVLIKKPLDNTIRIEHIDLKKPPRYPLGPFTPCIIADFNRTKNPIIYNNISYVPILKQKNLNLFAPESEAHKYDKP